MYYFNKTTLYYAVCSCQVFNMFSNSTWMNTVLEMAEAPDVGTKLASEIAAKENPDFLFNTQARKPGLRIRVDFCKLDPSPAFGSLTFRYLARQWL